MLDVTNWQLAIYTVTGVIVWMLTIGVIGTLRAQRRGGLTFVRIGNICITVCVAKKQAKG